LGRTPLAFGHDGEIATACARVAKMPRAQVLPMKATRAMHDLRPRHWIKIMLPLLAWMAATTVAAQAHPHVWATIQTELLFAPDGAVTGVRHIWTFDDMYSAFATTGIPARTKGQFTRQELQPLAQTNVESLKDFAFFTFAKIDGKRKRDAFNIPVDYWLDYDAKSKQLTLHFTLPFKTPVMAKQLLIEVYDPEFFVDFGPAENNPVSLIGAPPQCTVTAEKPPDQNFTSSQSLSQMFTNAEANIGMGMNFSNKILLKCP
jgi:ABC-type uncharacterized transport system substrate-binding protein